MDDGAFFVLAENENVPLHSMKWDVECVHRTGIEPVLPL